LATRRTQLPADPPPRYSGDTDDPDIKELHESFDYATDAWREIRYDGDIDMRYIAGDPWNPGDRAVREDAGRPVLSLDELGQYVNQIINDVRQNKRAIKVTPIGNGANDQTSQLRADLFRQIEYRSNAQQAYTTMFENAVQRSYGYLRIKAQYESPTSRHQELIIEPLMNPDLVTPDPDAVKPALEDMGFLFNQEAWGKTKFKKRFPKAKFQDFTVDQMRQAPRWLQTEQVMLAEWWRITETPAKVVYIDVPSPPTPQGPGASKQFDVLESELAKRRLVSFGPGAKVVGSRTAQVPHVSMRLTNGLEILEETDWPGRYIPFVGCFGKILYVDTGAGPQKRILSAIRLARDPAMLYCYYRTAEAEQVGMSTRFPYFVRRGALSPEEALKLTKSTHEPVAFITIEGLSDSLPAGEMPEMPQRNPFEPAIAALEAGAEGARRAIQAAMGISPLPTNMQRDQRLSGTAQQKLESSAQKGTFHFVDHYEAAITRVGVIMDDLVPHFYDAARDVTVRKPDETSMPVRVNDPQTPAPPDSPYAKDGAAPSLTDGDHDVTLSTGPSYDSEREAANDFADTVMGQLQVIAGVAGPQAAAKIMSMAVKLKDVGPLGDEMAKIIAPPEDPNAPQHAQQQLQQMQGQMQQMGQELQKFQAGVQVKQMEIASNEKIAAQKDATERYLGEMKIQADLAKMQATIEAKNAEIAIENETRRIDAALGDKGTIFETAHAAATQAADQHHERDMQAMEHAHERVKLAQQAVHSADAAEQLHGQSLEQQQQAAALQPPPTEPGA
jgi:hypothetical protein